MVSVSKGLTGKAPEKYYLDQAEKNQILCGLEPGAFWHGTLATMLRLNGKVKRKHLKNLLNGYSPTGRVKLAHNAGTHSKKRPRRKMNDLTFSPDKSVSYLAAVSPEAFRKQIVQAHLNAVRLTLTEHEPDLGFSRRDADGKVLQMSPIAWSLTTEFLNRANEPHLHTHAQAINIALRPDFTFGALEGKPFFQFRRTLDEGYHRHLANELRALGVEVKHQLLRTWIPAIPQIVCEAFSSRRRELQMEAASHGFRSAKSRQAAQELTRTEKKTAPADLFKQWAEKGEALGFGPKQANELIRETLARRPSEPLAKKKPTQTKEPIWYRKRPGFRIRPKHRRYKKILWRLWILGSDIRIQQTRLIGKYYVPSIRIVYPKKRSPWVKEIRSKIDNPFFKFSVEQRRVFPGAWGRSPLSKITVPAYRIQVKPWAIDGLVRLTEVARDRIEKRRLEREAQNRERDFQRQMEKQQEQTKTR
jgi:conjugative relaxase-like TrwC/TraI family protein